MRAGLVALSVAISAVARAEQVSVPIELQAELLLMVASHDANLPARAHGEVRTLVLTCAADESILGATQFEAAAGRRSSVAGLPHVVESAPYTGAGALAETVSRRRISIVYLAPGFSGSDVAAIGRALENGNVLTVAAAPSMVRRGVVLGFDLVAGRAKLIVDLTRAAKQRVAFGADVLGIMAVSK